MDVMGLLILLLPALSTPSLAASREYHLVSQPKNWTDAQSYCREKFSDLATMESEDDWNIVREMVANSGHDYVWIGLYEDVNTWRWSRDNASIYEDGNTLGSWFRLTVDNFKGRQSCGHTAGQQLGDISCQALLQSVCYDEPSNTFIKVTTPLSWLSARSHCRQKHTELADLRTQQEWDAVLSLAGSETLWVGLSRETWKWSDHSDCSFRKWDAGQPSSGVAHCGCTHVNGWHDGDCHLERPFICSAPIKKVLKVVLKTDGSVDPNEPQVQEAALKQMEKQLREQGVHQGFRLRRRKHPDGKVFNKTEL